MVDKSEKPSKADKILEVMDDLSAAVDGFAARLQALERLFDTINDNLVTVANRLADVQINADLSHGRIQDIQITVDVMKDRLEDIAKISENLEKNFPDFQEIADDIRRRELNDQREGLRKSRATTAFIQMMT